MQAFILCGFVHLREGKAWLEISAASCPYPIFCRSKPCGNNLEPESQRQLDVATNPVLFPTPALDNIGSVEYGDVLHGWLIKAMPCLSLRPGEKIPASPYLRSYATTDAALLISVELSITSPMSSVYLLLSLAIIKKKKIATKQLWGKYTHSINFRTKKKKNYFKNNIQKAKNEPNKIYKYSKMIFRLA